jgi:hypothetical protein
MLAITHIFPRQIKALLAFLVRGAKGRAAIGC